MCGIAGFLGGFQRNDAENIASAMASRIAHRGPDDSGIWVDASARIALAHRRLSIVDVSDAGHQPMVSRSGRYVIVYNGEVYNHLSLRRDLDPTAAVCWLGTSDTETLLAAFDAWGIEKAVRRTVGMFAFAVWDKREQCLTLARDRIGEKPLYYGWKRNVFLFASELKALRQHPAFDSEVNRDALALYLRHSCIPAPHSIYSGIRKLPPGCLLTIDGREQRTAHGRAAEPTPYWTVEGAVKTGLAEPFRGGDTEAVEELEKLLKESVQLQMLADVPLGAFLSGGIDSSCVVALMQSQSSRPVKTFTVGFHEDQYDEAKQAKQVANYLGTDHTEVYVSASDALTAIPRLPQLYDEPFADASQIPTFLISEFARRHVTVALSGDAGDELFGGYNRHLWAGRKPLSSMPASLRAGIARLVTSVSPATIDTLYGVVASWKRPAARLRQVGDKVHKFAEVLPENTVDSVYRNLISNWKNPGEIVLGGREPDVEGDALLAERLEPEHLMMYLDAVGYLPDDVLTKVDRAAMGASLETRVPFLDHRVFEFAWRMPLRMKIRDGTGKWALRQILYKHVPKELVARPKMGFGVPIGDWLSGPIRDWAETLLSPGLLKKQGFFRVEPIRKIWLDHISGAANRQNQLWAILMFQAWLQPNE
jgi:asparagine synthase (glutamine-hydrolysing)